MNIGQQTTSGGDLFGIDDAIIAFAAFNMAGSMMQAAFEGKSIWKAGGLSLLSSAASYGIGCGFGNTGNWGNEALRAGAHGLASGIVSALGGGNFLRSFVSGAAASVMGSYAQIVNMGPGPMVASTTLMGGVVAWATGGDFLQGAMRGMTIGMLNHAMHDGNGVITYSHDQKGNISGEISEVVVTSSRYTGCALIEVIANLNTFIDGTGVSLKEEGGNSTFGSNHHFYWHAKNERGFYRNQYVRTTKIVYVGGKITKVTGSIGFVMSTYDLYEGYQLDGGQIQTVGYNTIRATADIAGGCVGGWVGLKLGGFIGASLGGLPGAIIGGIIVGIGGSLGGSAIGTFSVDKAYGI